MAESAPELSGTLPQTAQAIQHPGKWDSLLDGDRFPPKFWLMPKDWPTCKIPQGQHVARVRVFMSNTDPSSQLGHGQAHRKCKPVLHIQSDTEKKDQAIQS